jgi:hypothetical protein
MAQWWLLHTKFCTADAPHLDERLRMHAVQPHGLSAALTLQSALHTQHIESMFLQVHHWQLHLAHARGAAGGAACVNNSCMLHARYHY